MQRATRWARTAGVFALALVTLIAALLGYSLSYPNTLKPLAESITEWALSRPLEINGDLTLALSMTPVISVSDAHLGNAAGAEAPYMITAGFAQAQIDLGALFDRRVLLLDLQAREAELYLEDSIDGPPNWQFFDAGPSDGDNWSFMIQQFRLTDGRIYATIGELAPIELSIPALEETSDATGHLNLRGHGEINGDPWRLGGRIGPFEELLTAGRVEMSLDLMVDDVEIGTEGSIGNLASLTGIDLGLTVYGPDADLLGEIFRMPESFAEDVALEAEIRPNAHGHRLRVFGHVSDFDVETEGTITDLANLDGWDGSARISGPDLGVVGKALQLEGFPDGPFEIRGELHLDGAELSLKEVAFRNDDTTLYLDADFQDFPSRDGAVASIRLSGADISEFGTLLRLPDIPPVPFDINVNLDASKSEFFSSTATVGQHTLNVAGALGEFPDFHGTELRASARGENIATLLQPFAGNQPLTGPYDATTMIVVDANGLSLRQSRLRISANTIEGDLNWPDPATLNTFEFRGQLAVENLAEAAAQFGVSGLPAFPATATGTLQLENGNLILKESVTRFRSLEMEADGKFGQLETLGDLNLNIEISGQRVDELFNDALADSSRPFRLKTRIRGRAEALIIDSFDLETTGGTFNAGGKLALAPGWAGSEFTLNGRGNRLNMLLPAFPEYSPPDKPWRLHAEVALPKAGRISFKKNRLEIGSISIKLDGVLDLDSRSGTSLTVTASGDRISDVGRIGDVPWPDDSFELSADLAGTTNSLHIENLDARWGNSDLTGEGSVVLSDRPTFEVHGRSRVLDIYDLQHALFGAPEDIDSGDDSGKIFADIPIPIDLFAGFDAIADIQVDRFRGQRARLEDINLALDIRDGVLKLDRAAYRDETGHFDATALLRPDGDDVYLELSLAGEDVDTGLFTSTVQQRGKVPLYTLDVDIWGHGGTVAELAGGLNGTLLVSSEGGEIDNGLLESLGGDFLTNVLEVLNPFVKSEEFTKMSCLVLNASLTDGTLKMEPGFVMRTDRLNMFVYGSADLEQETLDLSLATQARRGIGISAATITNPYFKIGGTLASPALQLDPASATIAASVATATAGLSILFRGMFERLKGTQNPCPRFLEFEQKSPVKPADQASSAS